MSIVFINKQNKLDEFCELIKSTDILGFDTEFVRRDTYFAKLSLIQIAIDDNVYVIDVLATDIKKLWFQIAESNILILVHSGSQDFEILYQLYKTLPQNVIDTQIAAKLCGYGSFASYATLCEKICNTIIDKKHQNSNWLIRDLPDSMIQYAASDVAMLKQIYLELKKLLTQNYFFHIYKKQYMQVC
ncbi:MAG UNVERIFIED_CONTAM: ribonuclease D [Rickettsiaceae bacterium]